MGQTAENLAQSRGICRQELDEFGVRSQNLAEKAIAAGFWAARDRARHDCRTAPSSAPDDGPRAGVTYEAVSQLKPVFRPTGSSPRATAARSTTARPPWSS